MYYIHTKWNCIALSSCPIFIYFLVPQHIHEKKKQRPVQFDDVPMKNDNVYLFLTLL